MGLDNFNYGPQKLRETEKSLGPEDDLSSTKKALEKQIKKSEW